MIIDNTISIDDMIQVPSVNVILGKRGSGKSSLAHYLLERLSTKYNLIPGIVGFPPDKKYLLPDNYIIFNDFNFPKDCIIFIDEVSFFAHSRRSMSNTNMIIDQLMSRARHMNWILVMATHHASKLDISIIRDADNIMFKEPSRLEVEYGSRKGFVCNIANKAKYLFTNIKTDRKPYVFFINEDCECMFSNSLSSYWSEELSTTTVVPLDNTNDSHDNSTGINVSLSGNKEFEICENTTLTPMEVCVVKKAFTDHRSCCTFRVYNKNELIYNNKNPDETIRNCVPLPHKCINDDSFPIKLTISLSDDAVMYETHNGIIFIYRDSIWNIVYNNFLQRKEWLTTLENVYSPPK